jgi:serine/threonine-protein kinase HipA
MNTVAEVKLWGKTIGAVSLQDREDVANFEYDAAFVRSGIQVSPIVMPLAPRVYRFPELSRQTFYGLPGLLADSLPDKFGNALIDAWLASQGRQPGSFNAIERLCYTGKRGMGALEFSPAISPREKQTTAPIAVSELVTLASEILTQRHRLQGSLTSKGETDALRDILRVGTSAGGARAKAVIAWNPHTNEVRSGQVKAGAGFEYWLLKFDGVSGNKDKEIEDPQGYGMIEYAYYLMARDCGIDISECRLFKENGRSHFMTRRFDRSATGEKRHMQSLCALAHYDFNMAGAYSYEQVFMVMRQLGLPVQAIEQFFRRMVFNIVARNQDDHVKNIAFLMTQSGEWSLAPAFDMTYSFNPTGAWTASHQMTMNGKRDHFTLADFNACAKTATIKRGRALSIISEVQATVSKWRLFAEQAGVPEDIADKIWRTLHVKTYG